MAQQQTKSPPAAAEGLSEAFDESILAEIEQRLESGDDQFDEAIAVGDKVELDRVDLPMDGFLPESTKLDSGEIEIDLADSGHLASADQGAEEEPQPPSKLKRLLLALGSLVLVVAIAGGTGFWFSRQEAHKLPDAESLPPWMVRQAMPSVEDELMLGLEPFIVPLLGAKEGQILRVVVTLESMDGLSKSSLIEKNLDVRDVIYRALRDRPADELRKANQNRLLQAQLKAELNHALGREWVHKVYFSQFLISG